MRKQNLSPWNCYRYFFILKKYKKYAFEFLRFKQQFTEKEHEKYIQKYFCSTVYELMQ